MLFLSHSYLPSPSASDMHLPSVFLGAMSLKDSIQAGDFLLLEISPVSVEMSEEVKGHHIRNSS